jgi:type VI protein secretion system component VasF
MGAVEAYGEGITMFIPVMLSVWGIAALVTAALFIYRTSLTRDEDDQIYLDEAFQHEKDAQEAIVAKVNKIEPMLRISLWAVGALTVIIVVYYIWDLLSEFMK